MKIQKLIALASLLTIAGGTLIAVGRNSNKIETQASDERPVFNYSTSGKYLSNIMALQTYHDWNCDDALAHVYNVDEDNRDYLPYIATEVAYAKSESLSTYADINIHSDDHIMLVTSGTDDDSKAITGLFCVVVPKDDVDSTDWDENPRTSITRMLHGFEITYTAVPSYDYDDNVVYPVADVNDDSGGAYVFLYQTTDIRAGQPLSRIMVDHFGINSYATGEPAFREDVVNWRAWWHDKNTSLSYVNIAHGVESANFPSALLYNRNDSYLFNYSVNFNGETVSSGYTEGYISSSLMSKFQIINNTPVDLYYDDTFSSDKKVKVGDIKRENITLYAKLIDLKNSTVETQVNYFVNGCMHITDYDTSYSGTGSNKCIDEEWYSIAKTCYTQLITNEAISTLNNGYLSQVGSTDTKDNIYYAMERFIEWGRINGEIVVIQAGSSYTISSNKAEIMSYDNGSIIATIISVSSIVLTGFIFVLNKKKKTN